MRISLNYFLHPFTSIHLDQKVTILTQRQQLVSIVSSIACTIFAHLNLTAVDQIKKIVLSMISGISAFYVITGLMRKISGAPSIQQKDPAVIPETIPPPNDLISGVKSEPKAIQDTPYKAKIAILSRSGGLTGPHKEYLEGTRVTCIDEENEGYLEYEWSIYDPWTLEDGTPFSLDPDVLVLEFVVFGLSPDLSKLGPAPLMHLRLPASLFEGKNEGETIRLKYKDELVELTIDQNTMSRIDEGAIFSEELRKKGIQETNIFAEVFQSVKAECLHRIDVGYLGFSGAIFGPKLSFHEGYTVDHQGTLFQLIKKEERSEMRLQQKPETNFRPLKNPEIRNARFEINATKMVWLLTVEIPGISQQVDVIVNEKYLCVYAQEEVMLPEDAKGKKEEREYLFILRWKEHFKGLSLEEIKAKITNAECQLANGLFTLKIERSAHI